MISHCFAMKPQVCILAVAILIFDFEDCGAELLLTPVIADWLGQQVASVIPIIPDHSGVFLAQNGPFGGRV